MLDFLRHSGTIRSMRFLTFSFALIMAVLFSACGNKEQPSALVSAVPVNLQSVARNPLPSVNTFYKTHSMTYAEWGPDAYDPAVTAAALKRLKEISGTNTVIFPVAFRQANKRSSVMSRDPKFTAPTKNVIAAIASAKKLGMRVILRPYLDIRDHSWRGEIKPLKVGRWFREYTAFQVAYARLAQQQRVEGVIIGVEMVSMNKYIKSWKGVIKQVRGVYGGWVAYQANYGEALPEIGKGAAVKWWDAVDVIAISAYYPLTMQKKPTAAQIQRGWTRYDDHNKIRNWKNLITKLHFRYKKPILFGEIGYRTRQSTATRPFDTRQSLGKYSPTAQASAYKGTLNAWKGVKWQAFSWWYVNRNIGKKTPVKGADHRPENPALLVLARAWK